MSHSHRPPSSNTPNVPIIPSATLFIFFSHHFRVHGRGLGVYRLQLSNLSSVDSFILYKPVLLLSPISFIPLDLPLISISSLSGRMEKRRLVADGRGNREIGGRGGGSGRDPILKSSWKADQED
ncbi:hypothetical protein BLNAU_3939 [Blattamonas nauphoetae]|uniref:Uncharacterized protein n=1 Tax=Blattamonas nauphoetae TaxID=2049346 RepID=A0ABQ9WN79_9EUKA|nr:hypothetical protein BLNAU_24141 [Blattamonas nauphoetae]KAK2943345.1 hypothetical protein BLNAU_21734 [Blattamonas nauphoetae]KAK2961171.1 hypothetical protein BLNAU_3939 [Blattamonas nauphoetae]